MSKLKLKLITIILLWVIVLGSSAGYALVNGIGMANWGNIWPVVATLAIIGMTTMIFSTKIKTVWKSTITGLFIALVLFGLGMASQAPSPYHLKVGFAYGATGRAVTWNYASSTATALEKADADAVGSGSGDFAVLNSAITAGYRNINLSSGAFTDATNSVTYPNAASGSYIATSSGVAISGQGKYTILNYTKATGYAVMMEGTGSGGNYSSNDWLENCIISAPNTNGGAVINQDAAWNHVVNVQVSVPNGIPFTQGGANAGSQQIYYENDEILAASTYDLYGTGLNLIAYVTGCNFIKNTTAAIYWHAGDTNSLLTLMNTQLSGTGKAFDCDSTKIYLSGAYLDSNLTTSSNITNSRMWISGSTLYTLGVLSPTTEVIYGDGNQLGAYYFSEPNSVPTDWLNRTISATETLEDTGVGNQIVTDSSASGGYCAQNVGAAAGVVFMHDFYVNQAIPAGQYLIEFRLKDSTQSANDPEFYVKDVLAGTYPLLVASGITLTASYQLYTFPIAFTGTTNTHGWDDYRIEIYSQNAGDTISADFYRLIYVGSGFDNYTYGGGQQMIVVGNSASLPTASVYYRNMIAVVDGGTGVTDTFYMCMKSAANAYSWVAVKTGG